MRSLLCESCFKSKSKQQNKEASAYPSSVNATSPALRAVAVSPTSAMPALLPATPGIRGKLYNGASAQANKYQMLLYVKKTQHWL